MAIKLGNNNVKLSLGSNEVKEMYLGSVKIYEKAPSSFTLTLTANGSWDNYDYWQAKLIIYKGTTTSGEKVVEYAQNNLVKTSFPKNIELESGDYCIEMANGGGLMGNDIASNDFIIRNFSYDTAVFTLNKNGSIAIYCDDWND